MAASIGIPIARRCTETHFLLEMGWGSKGKPRRESPALRQSSISGAELNVMRSFLDEMNCTQKKYLPKGSYCPWKSSRTSSKVTLGCSLTARAGMTAIAERFAYGMDIVKTHTDLLG